MKRTLKDEYILSSTSLASFTVRRRGASKPHVNICQSQKEHLNQCEQKIPVNRKAPEF